MSIILSLETATTAGSVALHKDGGLIGLQLYNIEKSHSRLVHKITEQLLSNCDIQKSEIDAIAVSGGPGSYTGLRIGTSSAKGLALALDVELIAVDTLESMALQVNRKRQPNALFCPMIDARRMEVYCAIFNTDMGRVEAAHPKIIEETSFEEYLNHAPVYFVGNGMNKCQPIIQHKNAHFIDGIVPSAAQIGTIATQKYERQEFENLTLYEPAYLKEFQAIKPKSQL